LQNPSVQYNTFGVYSVTLTATNTYGSGTTTKTDYIHVDIDGIDLVSSDKINIYPNPSSGKVSITNPTGNAVEVQIFTLLGTKIETTKSSAEIISLDLSRIPHGIYLIKLTDTTGNTITTSKLILK